MGDLLMTLPALHAFRCVYPKAHTTLLLRQGLQPLLKTHPDIDRLLPWEMPERTGWRGALSWASKLRKENFDLAVIFNPTKALHAAAFLAGIPVRVGYRRKLGFLLTHSIPDTKAGRMLHESAYNLELLRLLGIPEEEPFLRLPVEESDRQRVHQFLERHGVYPSTRRIVALHPLTSNAGKAWPLQAFEQLASRLACEPGIQVIWIGEPEDNPQWISELTVNLTGQIPLELLPAVLQACHALVSNDSGPVHVAAAVGTPVTVVAPESHAALLSRWRPLGNGHRALLSPNVEAVASAVMEALGTGSSHTESHAGSDR